MLEKNLNKRVIRALAGLHPFRVENGCLAGTPDIAYSHGWIESKILNRWPQQGTTVRVPHFSPEQRLWHLQHSLSGGASYIIIQIEKTILLLRGYDATMMLGKCDEKALRGLALGTWERGLDANELQRLIMTE